MSSLQHMSRQLIYAARLPPQENCRLPQLHRKVASSGKKRIRRRRKILDGWRRNKERGPVSAKKKSSKTRAKKKKTLVVSQVRSSLYAAKARGADRNADRRGRAPPHETIGAPVYSTLSM